MSVGCSVGLAVRLHGLLASVNNVFDSMPGAKLTDIGNRLLTKNMHCHHLMPSLFSSLSLGQVLDIKLSVPLISHISSIVCDIQNARLRLFGKNVTFRYYSVKYYWNNLFYTN